MCIVAGWSSLVARRAHNPKVVGSNPALATNFNNKVYADHTNTFINDISFFPNTRYALNFFNEVGGR